MTVAPITSVRQLAELLTLLGRTPSIEAADLGPGWFSELDHGLQCAHELWLRAPDDTELQVAGLVHDIGHQFSDDPSHGHVGGAAVRDLLGDRVAALVTAHVPAKRYLVTASDAYAEALSPDSRATLIVQGGAMAPTEMAAFRATRHWKDAVALRIADDAAKIPGRAVPGLEHWLPAITDLARAGTTVDI